MTQREHIPPLVPFREISKRKAVKRAERLLSKVEKPGKMLETLEPPVDWGANPDRNRYAHASRNSLRALGPVLWAFHKTGNAKYLNYEKSVVDDWIQYNLVDAKPNRMKWHDKPSGERAIHLAYVLDRELRASNSQVDRVGRLVWAAQQHAAKLADPRLFNTGNHALYVILGLKALATALPTLKGSEQFASYADEKMAQLLRIRYFEDGFHREHSAEYHFITIRSVESILAMGLFEKMPKVRRQLDLAKQVAYQLHHPNGDRLNINDSQRNGKPAALKEHLEFLSSEGKRGKAPASGLVAHETTGYAFYRSSWNEKPFKDHSYLFFAPGYHSDAHKHADHLSFEWSESGHPIVVDSGKYDFSRGAWRAFFTSTRAGNAVEVDGKDFSTKPKHAWGAGLTAHGSVRDLIFMQADVRHAGLGVQQRRTLVLKPRRWLCVVDSLSARKRHTFRQWFHFHEAFEVSKTKAGFVAKLEGEKDVFSQLLNSDARADRELFRGETEPRRSGWLSPRKRVKHKRASIALRQRGEEVLFVTLLSLGAPPRSPRVQRTPRGVEVAFLLDGQLERFVESVDGVRGGQLREPAGR